jgi:branched-chain amino acid transport system permease protein
LVVVVLLVALPFIVAILDGQTIAGMLASEPGQSKFVQGLMIEIFILGIYAISYDLVLGVTGLLSFGHAMFFAVGAYLTGVMLKSFGWPLLPTLVLIAVAGVFQALLFGIVLPRVSGLTFALVTLGIASVFDIVIRTREVAEFTGADVGLQGVPRPDFINPATARLTFYYLALVVAVLIYLLFRRFVSSPTGRVCIAIRENEDRARMLGFNTFYFKLAALILAAITAGYAGALNALYMPIVSPEIATMGYTVQGLLIILIGGMGTLSGAMIGAAVYRLLDFYLLRWFGESSGFILGAVFVALVLFVPYGVVGTWKLRSFQWRQGWHRLLDLITADKQATKEEE